MDSSLIGSKPNQTQFILFMNRRKVNLKRLTLRNNIQGLSKSMKYLWVIVFLDSWLICRAYIKKVARTDTFCLWVIDMQEFLWMYLGPRPHMVYRICTTMIICVVIWNFGVVGKLSCLWVNIVLRIASQLYRQAIFNLVHLHLAVEVQVLRK